MTDLTPELDAFGRLHAALASATQYAGVGCHFWTRPTLGVPANQLEALGLAKIIKTRVPVCEVHGCAIIKTCTEQVSFVERRGGIGNWKFRLTALGTEAATRPEILAQQVASQPLPQQILGVLAASGGPTSWPDLYWQLVTPELAALEETGQRPDPPVSRPAVRLYLDLLVTAGLVLEDARNSTVRLPG